MPGGGPAGGGSIPGGGPAGGGRTPGGGPAGGGNTAPDVLGPAGLPARITLKAINSWHARLIKALAHLTRHAATLLSTSARSCKRGTVLAELWKSFQHDDAAGASQRDRAECTS